MTAPKATMTVPDVTQPDAAGKQARRVPKSPLDYLHRRYGMTYA